MPKGCVFVSDFLHLTALGRTDPHVERIGAVTIAERFSLSIVSISLRRGVVHHDEIWDELSTISKFQTRPGQWFAIGEYDVSFSNSAKAVFGARATFTDQTDAWVIFDVAGPDTLFEKLCNVDVRKLEEGAAVRTVIAYIGCFLLRANGSFRVLGERSMAQSLHHSLTRAARSL
ncbi:hypothetical protein GOB36_30885 [Sinorhizobium meliloti]|nr:hypothetical protein [Sinorhizobium meliloti]MDX0036136.1 hypothetical protein [Sinorhizobium meliloti]RVK27936.1 hypothetical protein CN163_30400 [Sinorhizobium meliloti]